jgi:DNA-binding CsgD family transcriptional regulator
MDEGARNGGPEWQRNPALEPRLEGVVLKIAKRFGLSPREVEIVIRSSMGIGTKQVAADLGCSAKTVHEHWRRILKKAGLSSRWELGAEVLAGALDHSEPCEGEVSGAWPMSESAAHGRNE